MNLQNVIISTKTIEKPFTALNRYLILETTVTNFETNLFKRRTPSPKPTH